MIERTIFDKKNKDIVYPPLTLFPLYFFLKFLKVLQSHFSIIIGPHTSIINVAALRFNFMLISQ